MAKRRKKSTKTTKLTQMQSNYAGACSYCCCPNHRGWGLIILLVGLLFLIKDYTGGPVLWRVSWYTVLFLILGLTMASKK